MEPEPDHRILTSTTRMLCGRDLEAHGLLEPGSELSLREDQDVLMKRPTGVDEGERIIKAWRVKKPVKRPGVPTYNHLKQDVLRQRIRDIIMEISDLKFSSIRNINDASGEAQLERMTQKLIKELHEKSWLYNFHHYA